MLQFRKSVTALCAFLALLLLAQPVLAKPKPQIEIILETAEAFLGDTVVVEVRWRGLDDPVDFTPLTAIADIERETAGTRLAVIDGEVIEIVSRRIEIRPRALGRLMIGPLHSGDVVSNTVSIDITRATTIDWTPTDDDIRLQQFVSTRTPWLQQQVVVDVELRTRHPMADETVTLPTFEGFRVVPVFTERRTLEEEDGGWSKVAWRYLVFPQQSGPRIITGARVAGLAMKSRAERARFSLAAPDTAMEIKPSVYRGDWWIAARNVVLSDEWSSDPTKLSAGDEVERTIRVKADGALAEQIPDLTPGETRGLSFTPLGSKREQKIVGDVLTSTAEFRYRMRATSPVPVFLNTVRLRWWNTVNEQAAESIIPARRIDIGIPDRSALVERAASEQGWWERLLIEAGKLDAWLYASLAIAVATLAIFLALRPAWRRHLRDAWAHWRLARQLTALGVAGDAKALYARLKALARNPDLASPLRQPLALLEAKLFANADADIAAIASMALKAIHAGRASNQHALLPSL